MELRGNVALAMASLDRTVKGTIRLSSPCLFFGALNRTQDLSAVGFLYCLHIASPGNPQL